MRRGILPTVLSAAAGLVLFGYAATSGAQLVLATGPDADVTAEGLHRVDPAILEAAWVRPELDLSRYTRLMLMPTAVQFREVAERHYNMRSREMTAEFPLNAERKAWLRREWREAVAARFAREDSYELYTEVGPDVLVVQGFLVDVVSRIPPDIAGSGVTFVSDPWTVYVVLELRDGTTTELLARTIDLVQGQGILEAAKVWFRTEDLVERWAEVLSNRLEQLSELGGRSRRIPAWAR